VQGVGRLWHEIIERRGDASVASTTTKTSKLQDVFSFKRVVFSIFFVDLLITNDPMI
jgi:hypothetical protein